MTLDGSDLDGEPGQVWARVWSCRVVATVFRVVGRALKDIV